MQQPGKGILPIFNRKKRPRQAIFSYPNKNESGGSNTGDADPSRSSQYGNPSMNQPGYMQPKQQSEQRSQPYSNNNNSGFQSVRNNSFSSYGNANVNKLQNDNRQPTGNSGPSNKPPGFLASKSPHTKPQYGGMSSNNQSRQQYSRQPSYNQRGQQQHGNNANSTVRNGQNNFQSFRSTQPQGKSFQSFNKPTPPRSKRPFNHSTPATQSSPRDPPPSSSFNGGSSSYNRGNSSYNSANSSYTHDTRGPQYGGQSAVPSQPTVSSQPNPGNVNTNNRQAVLLPFQGQGTAPPPTAPVLDKSMKILTASIEGMKHWSKYSDAVGLLFFEIFGILNSATTMDEMGAAKLFSLKDGQHSQRCIFYEIDRNLPRFTRGQWLRCVGSLEKKSGLFRVVTVRQASQQEQGTAKAVIAKCDQAMNERIAEMQEP